MMRAAAILLASLLSLAGCDSANDAPPGSDAAAGSDATPGDASTPSPDTMMLVDAGQPIPDRGVMPASDAGALTYAPCDHADRLGSFEVVLSESFTSVQGQVANAVTPSRVPGTTATAGECRLLQPPILFCDPSCGAGTTCAPSGECVPAPTNISVGTVTVTGLKAPVEMTASPPVFFYTHRGALAHPGFDEGDPIALEAAGEGDIAAFRLRGQGVAPLDVAADSFPLERDRPTVIRWTAPAATGPARIHLNLNIANHGGTPAWIECDVEDTGQFEVPVSLTNQLLDLGFSGFPSVVLTRRSLDSATTTAGCIEFAIQSVVGVGLEIPGLVSCSFDEDCPEGQLCRADLTCGDRMNGE